jgi:hypothetical protein
MQNLEIALLALESEIFADDTAMTDNDDFLVTVLSHWSAAKRRDTISALIGSYGRPDIGSHIVHALARLICRDVALVLDGVVERVKHPPRAETYQSGS